MAELLDPPLLNQTSAASGKTHESGSSGFGITGRKDHAATHSEEIDYVFGKLGASRWVLRAPMNAADRQLSDTMMGAWVRFAQTGDPNGGELPTWPRFNAKTDPYLDFGNEIEAGHGYRTQYLDFVQGFVLAGASPR